MVGTTMFRGAAAAAGGSVLLLVTGGSAWAQADPPGNNGTVKIDGVELDDHPDDQPHVGCQFQVDLYGFDQGDLEATVLFEAIPPTTEDTVPPGAGQELLADVVAIGEDAAGGGTDLDAARTYDLTEALSDITPHPQQGWHLRLIVHAEGSRGADTKHKVFWVSDCETTPPTSSSTTSSSTITTTSAPGGSTSSTTSTTVGPTPPTTGPDDDASPSGPSSTAPSDGSGQLPRTGSDILPIAIGAVVLVALGAALVAARRVRLGSGFTGS